MESGEKEGKKAVRNEGDAQVQSDFKEICEQCDERVKASFYNEASVRIIDVRFLVNMNYAF